MYIYVSLFIALVGLLVYALTKDNSKVLEVGRIMFWVGLLAFLLRISSSTIEIFK